MIQLFINGHKYRLKYVKMYHNMSNFKKVTPLSLVVVLPDRKLIEIRHAHIKQNIFKF